MRFTIKNKCQAFGNIQNLILNESKINYDKQYLYISINPQHALDNVCELNSRRILFLNFVIICVEYGSNNALISRAGYLCYFEIFFSQNNEWMGIFDT